ncbi:hypothetical protein C2E20_1957 [Micractinium conductrix]|uniref:Uncharacterized protein n=1 Tax=Micractinium conductrix TaxID=554055 RepID=A0A2P6VM37_9CHLO|nr:hypothetical protein C2E20_1957 [Micractinium conductrix]|eukprot:PSC75117.1 hypothetical protein C2E20_1957 [Micractinium conductrix]
MYPPPCEGLKPLHSIKSGQQWDNSHSFYDNWKPPSSLKRLLSAIRHAQEEEPGKHVGMQRKPTGYVPPAALPAEMQEGGELAGDAAAACAAAGSPPSQRQQQQQLEQEGYAQLATLDEEAYVEVVEEFSLTRGSAASRWQSGDGAEQSSEAVREPPQPSSQPPSPPRKLQQQGSQGSAFSQHDDSAYESQARESNLGQVLGGPPPLYQQHGHHAQQQYQQQQQQQHHHHHHQEYDYDEEPEYANEEDEPEYAAAPEPPPSNFAKRSMARLGGEGMAALLGGTAPPGAGVGGRPAAKPAGAGQFMSALHDLRAGLSDAQRDRAAVQREQLKRDLEEQMRVKKEAEVVRKRALAELEEREEAELKAYWQQQDRGAAGGRGAASAPAHPPAQPPAAQAGAQRRRAPAEAGGRAGQRAPPPPEPAAPAGRSPPGGARRGEAFMQPGITVFLPPDKEAERQGALRARRAAESWSEEAEPEAQTVAPRARQPPATAGDRQEQASPGAAWQQVLLAQAAQQQALLNQALLGSPALLPQLYAMQPAVLPAAAAPAAPAPAGSDPQLLAVLRELAEGQQRMQQHFAAQLQAVSQLSGDAAAARGERDRARTDLERVQRMLAERQLGGGAAVGGYGGDRSMDSSDELLAVTSHVLPLGVGIPSRLPTARGVPPPVQPPAKAWQQQRQQQWGGGAARATPAAGAQPGRQGRPSVTGAAGKGKPAAAAGKGPTAATGPRGTWRK